MFSLFLSILTTLEATTHALKPPNYFFSFSDWSSTFLDYRGVKAELDSVSKGYLLPPEPVPGVIKNNHHPLLWFQILKRILQLDEKSNLHLKLTNIFSILYLLERELVAKAHYSHVDVDMYHGIVRFLAHAWKNQVLPGRIDKWLVQVTPQEGDDVAVIEDEATVQVIEEEESQRTTFDDNLDAEEGDCLAGADG